MFRLYVSCYSNDYQQYYNHRNHITHFSVLSFMIMVLILLNMPLSWKIILPILILIINLSLIIFMYLQKIESSYPEYQNKYIIPNKVDTIQHKHLRSINENIQKSFEILDKLSIQDIEYIKDMHNKLSKVFNNIPYNKSDIDKMYQIYTILNCKHKNIATENMLHFSQYKQDLSFLLQKIKIIKENSYTLSEFNILLDILSKSDMTFMNIIKDQLYYDIQVLRSFSNDQLYNINQFYIQCSNKLTEFIDIMFTEYNKEEDIQIIKNNLIVANYKNYHPFIVLLFSKIIYDLYEYSYVTLPCDAEYIDLEISQISTSIFDKIIYFFADGIDAYSCINWNNTCDKLLFQDNCNIYIEYNNKVNFQNKSITCNGIGSIFALLIACKNIILIPVKYQNSIALCVYFKHNNNIVLAKSKNTNSNYILI